MPRESEAIPFSSRSRLESWKEVAAYLSRSERTVRRWEEHEGLPVHRLQHDKRGSIYAFTHELDAWRESRAQLLKSEPPETPPVLAFPALASSVGNSGRRAWTSSWRLIGATAFIAVLLGGGWLATRRAAPAARVPNPEAVRAVEKATFRANAGRVQIETGIRYYQEAIRLDPAYAPAWSGLAAAHVAQTWFAEVAPSETMTSARKEAREALRLDPGSAQAWRVLAFASHYLDWDHATAERSFRKAIALAPGDSVAHCWFGDFLTDSRRFDEARRSYKDAQDVAPRWLGPITYAGNVHLFTGHIDLAISEYRRALEIEPTYGLANHYLGRALLASGRNEEAVAQLRKSNELLGQVPFSVGDFGYALAIAGRRDEAERLLADLLSKRERSYYPAFAIAEIQLGLGRLDQALDWLERAADERHMGFYLPSVDPTYDPVRSHPRFRALLQRMNLNRV